MTLDSADETSRPFVTNGLRSGREEPVEVLPVGVDQCVQQWSGDLAADERRIGELSPS